MPTSEQFWDAMANTYAARPIKNVEAYEKTMERTRLYLKPDDKVLELGCGSGSTALLLSPHVGHIWASDISSRLIEIGRQKAKDQNVTNVDFIHGDILAPAIDEHAPYNGIWAFNFMHLLEDIPASLERMHKLLKPGGVLISKTACLSGRHGLLRIPITIMQWFGKAPHVSYISAEKLELLMQAQGFEILESCTFPKASEVRFIVARKL
ncbi:class I SAM-dependent methyltransferase [Cohaesibacter haloalkalitolerans]|uniref:class I SAM-dependent methyltransferase n=1 Tax=Cohaesibacter haloalkalitolerans TaxID=1162980 RepID=UPI000E65E919|nr:class I SAM-dependent methyltransferase [Cohaesibacter haloalkalitolerans]